MKILVEQPASGFEPKQNILYWMTYALFGETSGLFVTGVEDPWYCAPNLPHGLFNWNNPTLLPAASKPQKLVSLIQFHINADIDIGRDASGSDGDVAQDINKLAVATSSSSSSVVMPRARSTGGRTCFLVLSQLLV